MSIQFGDERIFNENFIQEFKNLKINQDNEHSNYHVSFRRQDPNSAAELLTKENYTCAEIFLTVLKAIKKMLVGKKVICHVNKRFKR